MERDGLRGGGSGADLEKYGGEVHCAKHCDEPLKAKIMSAEASIIFESPRHDTTIEFEHLYLSHLSFNFTSGNYFVAEEMLASVMGF